MGKEFKSSFIGYKPKDVEALIDVEASEFEKLYKEYNEELQAAAEENQKLKDELEDMKQKSASFVSSRDKLEKMLYNTHIQAATVLYNNEKKLEEMVKEKTRILEEQHNKNSEIKASINKLLNDIKSIVED